MEGRTLCTSGARIETWTTCIEVRLRDILAARFYLRYILLSAGSSERRWLTGCYVKYTISGWQIRTSTHFSLLTFMHCIYSDIRATAHQESCEWRGSSSWPGQWRTPLCLRWHYNGCWCHGSGKWFRWCIFLCRTSVFAYLLMSPEISDTSLLQYDGAHVTRDHNIVSAKFCTLSLLFTVSLKSAVSWFEQKNPLLRA